MTLFSGTLEDVLFKFGFTSSWVNLVMQCVSIINFIVHINGVDSEIFLRRKVSIKENPSPPICSCYV